MPFHKQLLPKLPRQIILLALTLVIFMSEVEVSVVVVVNRVVEINFLIEVELVVDVLEVVGSIKKKFVVV